MGDLAARLDAVLTERFGAKADSTSVNEVRAEILRQCTASADDESGLFTLDVPAGEASNHGFWNLFYPGARSTTVCLVMGKIAGESAAQGISE